MDAYDHCPYRPHSLATGVLFSNHGLWDLLHLVMQLLTKKIESSCQSVLNTSILSPQTHYKIISTYSHTFIHKISLINAHVCKEIIQFEIYKIYVLSSKLNCIFISVRVDRARLKEPIKVLFYLQNKIEISKVFQKHLNIWCSDLYIGFEQLIAASFWIIWFGCSSVYTANKGYCKPELPKAQGTQLFKGKHSVYR